MDAQAFATALARELFANNPVRQGLLSFQTAEQEPTMMTRSIARTLTLAALMTLTACGQEPQTETPPDVGTTVHDAAPPPAIISMPLVMGPQVVTAPDLIADADGTYRHSPTYETCTSQTPSCATWGATLPPTPAGYTPRVEMRVPMARVSGNSVVTVDQRDGQTTCEEPMQVWTFYQKTGGDRLPLPLGPVAVEPGTLTVGVCFSGVVYARLGAPSVTLTYTRVEGQPLSPVRYCGQDYDCSDDQQCVGGACARTR